MQIKYNISPRKDKIKYLVIHDTGNTSKGSGAMAHFNYFNSANIDASADFFVDDKTTLQVNNYEKYYTWHCGDGKGKYGITNENSIGIEICVNSDSNYNKAFLNAVELTKELMQRLNIPIENVVRHYDASRKNCPASMVANGWAYWQDFKNRIAGENEMNECNFTDIKGHYAEEQIKELFEMGVVNGVDESYYFPEEPITRADVAIVARNVIRYITGK